MELTLRRRAIARTLAAAILILVIGDLGAKLMKDLAGRDYVYGLVPSFQVGGEANIPTWYSSIALAVAAGLLAISAVLVRRSGGPYWRHWAALGVIFLMLSMDEVAQLHELTVRPVTAILKNQFLWYISWVVPAGVLLVVFGIAYWRFFLALPGPTRRGFAVAFMVYVGGALGMELATAAFGRMWEERFHFLFNLTEETMEMAGVVILILTVTGFIERGFGSVTIRLQDARKE